MAWELVTPIRYDKYPVDLDDWNHPLEVSTPTGLSVIGSGSVLRTQETPSAAEVAEADWYWTGGHRHVTEDPAIRDLWLDNGYEVLEV